MNVAQIFLVETFNQWVVNLIFFIFLAILAFVFFLQLWRQKKTNSILEKTSTELEQLRRFRSHLFSLASHQFKSPLASIKGYAQILAEGLYGPVNEKEKETLEKIKKSTDDLIIVMDTLVQLRDFEEGKIRYAFSKTDICAVMRNAVEETNKFALTKKLDVQVSCPEHRLYVHADSKYLRHAIENIVVNAIQYTSAGFVKIAVGLDASNVIVSVTDSGQGIIPELLPFVFEEFVRDEQVRMRVQGIGLGLAIAKKIIEAHGGDVRAESGGEDKGSTFTIVLPQET